MKQFLFLSLFAVLASVTPASADPPGTKDWLWANHRQGNVRDQKAVTCSGSGGTVLLTAAETSNALSITFQNIEASGSNSATLCPRAAGANQCDAPSKGANTIAPGNGFTTDKSGTGAWSCDGVGGNAQVTVYLERFYPGGNRPASDPAPTPIP